MTRKLEDGTVIIENEPDTKCTRCGKITECRDVNADGNQICFFCTTEIERKEYAKRLFGYNIGYFTFGKRSQGKVK